LEFNGEFYKGGFYALKIPQDLVPWEPKNKLDEMRKMNKA